MLSVMRDLTRHEAGGELDKDAEEEEKKDADDESYL